MSVAALLMFMCLAWIIVGFGSRIEALEDRIAKLEGDKENPDAEA